ncbi:translation initiation factor 4G [Acrasis kona]|uniref:Translation initiation factor 4G n=1 Tax=Acrasis kona TaxID=1008807 RepID=A0AAW2ZKM6_9EUKA
MSSTPKGNAWQTQSSNRGNQKRPNNSGSNSGLKSGPTSSTTNNTQVKPTQNGTTPSQAPSGQSNSQPGDNRNKPNTAVKPLSKHDQALLINRTSSAPPNIGEQEAAFQKFIPEKGRMNIQDAKMPPQTNPTVPSTSAPSPQQGTTPPQNVTPQPSTTNSNTNNSQNPSTIQHQTQPLTVGSQPFTPGSHSDRSHTSMHPRPFVPAHGYAPGPYNPNYYGAQQYPPYQQQFFHQPYNNQPYVPPQTTGRKQIQKPVRKPILITDASNKPVDIQTLIKEDKPTLKGDSHDEKEEAKSEPKKEETASAAPAAKDNVEQKQEQPAEPKSEESKKDQQPSSTAAEEKDEKDQVSIKKEEPTIKKEETAAATEASNEEKEAVVAEPKQDKKEEQVIVEEEVKPAVEPVKVEPVEETKSEEQSTSTEQSESNEKEPEQADKEESKDDQDAKKEEEAAPAASKKIELEPIQTKTTPSGKIRYTRDELFTIQQKMMSNGSINIPKDMQNNSVFKELDKTQQQKPFSSPRTPQTPGLGRSSMGRGNKSAKTSESPFAGGFESYRQQLKEESRGNSSKRGKGRPGKEGRTPREPKQPQEILPVSENAWKAGKLTTSEKEATRLEVRGVLNRLTREKYEELKKEFLAIKIESQESLTDIISEVYDAAVTQPNFSDLYAELCKNLSKEISTEQQSGEMRQDMFKRTLLNKCQEEFTKKEKGEVEGENLAPEEREYREFLARSRMFGNMIFIGELFKQNMLSEKIMHEVIRSLIIKDEVSEPDIENVCKLLSVIGKKLEHEKSIKLVNVYFAKITNLSQEKTYSSRVRFLLQDLIDLRKDNWEPRIKVAKSKTIKEVREDAKKEKAKQEQDRKKVISASSNKYDDRDSRRGSDRNLDRRGNAMNSRRDESMSSGRGRGLLRQSSDTRLAARSDRYNQMSNASSGRLGPSPNVKNQTPATSSQNNTPNKKPKAGGIAVNQFDVLDEDNGDDQNTSEEEEEEEEEEQVEQAEEEEEEEDEDLEQIEEDCKLIIKDYIESGEIDDSKQDFEKKVPTKHHSRLVKVAVQVMFDNKSQEQDEICKLVRDLDALTASNVATGLEQSMEHIINNEVYFDVPQAFVIWGGAVGKFIIYDRIHLDSIHQIILQSKCSAKQSKQIFTSIADKLIEEKEFASKSEWSQLTQRIDSSRLNGISVWNNSSDALSDYASEMTKSKSSDWEVATSVLCAAIAQESNQELTDRLKDANVAGKIALGLAAASVATNDANVFEKYGDLLRSAIKDAKDQVQVLNALQDVNDKDVAGLFGKFKSFIGADAYSEWKVQADKAVADKTAGIF